MTTRRTPRSLAAKETTAKRKREVQRIKKELEESRGIAPGYLVINSLYVTPQECLKEYVLKSRLGSGLFGSVYEVCKRHSPSEQQGTLPQGCPYVVKIVPINATLFTRACDPSSDEFDEENCTIVVRLPRFNREVSISKEMGELGIGPKIIGDSWTCPVKSPLHKLIFGKEDVTLGFFVMERFDITLAEYKTKYPAQWNINKQIIGETILKLLHKMIYQASYDHIDLHSGNVLLRLDGNNNPTQIVLIDFGEAVDLDPKRAAFRTSGLVVSDLLED